MASIALALTDEQRALKAGVTEICKRYPGEYWRDLDANKAFPAEIWQAIFDPRLSAGPVSRLILSR